MILINEHEILLDESEGLLPWRSYDQVVWLAMDFIRRCPADSRTGLPWYLIHSCFWTDPLRVADWPDNPAGKFAMAVETLVRYYAFSGESWFTDVARTMLDRLIAYHTPGSWNWPGVPYSSAESGTGVYFGARADGHYVTEPDKVAQAALGYLRFYQMTGEAAYLGQARQCADVLARKVEPGDAVRSPWPFRVNARDGTVVEAYTSHVLPAVQLFDELDRLGYGDAQHRNARKLAWDWLQHCPCRTNLWKGYFEDIRLDPQNENRDQYSPLGLARYLLEHTEDHPQWREQVAALIRWVEEALGSAPFYKALPIHEQKFCFHTMGSHTARWAAVCALYAERTGDEAYAERARRAFNWATYMADDNGWVRVGMDRPDYYNQCWFTDGYFDYVPHFLDGMAAMPETAPATADHLLRSSSVVQRIDYAPLRIRYRTFDADAVEALRLTFFPEVITAGGEPLAQVENPGVEVGWAFDPALRVLQLHHHRAEVEVSGDARAVHGAGDDRS